MNALEQLKSIVMASSSSAAGSAHPFIATHGPAIVELIEAAQKIANGAHPWMETPVKLRFELFAAVGKLTEDKP